MSAGPHSCETPHYAFELRWAPSMERRSYDPPTQLHTLGDLKGKVVGVDISIVNNLAFELCRRRCPVPCPPPGGGDGHYVPFEQRLRCLRVCGRDVSSSCSIGLAGTQAGRHAGTQARRHAGTQARRHAGTQARRHTTPSPGTQSHTPIPRDPGTPPHPHGPKPQTPIPRDPRSPPPHPRGPPIMGFASCPNCFWSI